MAQKAQKGSGPNDWVQEKFRLNKKQFLTLLKKVKPYFSVLIPERFDYSSALLEALDFLATGKGPSSNTREVLFCVAKCLKEEYCHFPSSFKEWFKVTKDFEEKWNAKHTVGSVVSARVLCVPPKSCAAIYLDSKTGEHGLHVTFAVDAQYRIMFGGQGGFGFIKSPDDTVIGIDAKLEESPLPKGDFRMVADEGFVHRPWLHVASDKKPKEYNEGIKRGLKPGNIVHNILFSRFGVLTSNFDASGQDVWTITCMAILCLHNYFLAHSPAYASEFMDTKKWVDVDVEKMPLRTPKLEREVDDVQWMKKIFLTEERFETLIKVLQGPLATMGLGNAIEPMKLRVCLRFLVTGELYDNLASQLVKSTMDLLKPLIRVVLDKNPRKVKDLKEKFQLENCGGVVVTKRTSSYSILEHADRLSMYVLVITGDGHVGFYIEVLRFDASLSLTASAVEATLRDAKEDLLKSHNSPRFMVGNDEMKRNNFLVTPKEPRGHSPEKVKEALDYGQKVLKKICSLYRVTRFNREVSLYNYSFDLGTSLIFDGLHNFFMDYNPEYAKEFEGL